MKNRDCVCKNDTLGVLTIEEKEKTYDVTVLCKTHGKNLFRATVIGNARIFPFIGRMATAGISVKEIRFRGLRSYSPSKKKR